MLKKMKKYNSNSTSSISILKKYIIYLIGIVYQGTIITMITNSISICISLVCVIDIWAVITVIENICQDEKAIQMKPDVEIPDKTTFFSIVRNGDFSPHFTLPQSLNEVRSKESD